MDAGKANKCSGPLSRCTDISRATADPLSDPASTPATLQPSSSTNFIYFKCTTARSHRIDHNHTHSTPAIWIARCSRTHFFFYDRHITSSRRYSQKRTKLRFILLNFFCFYFLFRYFSCSFFVFRYFEIYIFFAIIISKFRFLLVLILSSDVSVDKPASSSLEHEFL